VADRTESSIVIDAEPSAVLAVIADFEAYPEWTGAVRDVAVLGTNPAGRADQVRFTLDAGAIRDTYTLAYTWDVDGLPETGTGTLEWSLVEATVLKAMDGSYQVEPSGDGTLVTYRLSVDLRMPMLGMLRRKAERVIIDTALNELKKRVEA
jgi:ribosome-associated toxin RatA of RatAB toxin-antitoxin module